MGIWVLGKENNKQPLVMMKTRVGPRTHSHPAVEQGPALAGAGVPELALVVGGGERDEDAGKHLLGLCGVVCMGG